MVAYPLVRFHFSLWDCETVFYTVHVLQINRVHWNWSNRIDNHLLTNMNVIRIKRIAGVTDSPMRALRTDQWMNFYGKSYKEY